MSADLSPHNVLREATAYGIRSCSILQLPWPTVTRPLISKWGRNSQGLAGKRALTIIIGCHVRDWDWCRLFTEVYHDHYDSMLRYKIWRQVRFEKILLCDEAIVSTNSTRKAIVRNDNSSEIFIEETQIFLVSRRIAYSDKLFRIFKSVTVRSCPRAFPAIRHKNDGANANIISSVGILSAFEVMRGMQAMETALKAEVKAAIREVIAVIWEVSAAIWEVEDATWEVEAAIREVDFSILVKVFWCKGLFFC